MLVDFIIWFFCICWSYSTFLHLWHLAKKDHVTVETNLLIIMSIYFFYGEHSLDLNDSSLMMVTFQPFVQYQNSMETMKTFDFLWWLKWEGPILCILKDKNLLQSLTNRVLHTWHRRQRKILFPENYWEPTNMMINWLCQKKVIEGTEYIFHLVHK